MFYCNKDYYKGEFLNGMKHGEGKYTFGDKKGFYEGDWKNDLKHGWGTFSFPNNETY